MFDQIIHTEGVLLGSPLNIFALGIVRAYQILQDIYIFEIYIFSCVVIRFHSGTESERSRKSLLKQ